MTLFEVHHHATNGVIWHACYAMTPEQIQHWIWGDLNAFIFEYLVRQAAWKSGSWEGDWRGSTRELPPWVAR